ncbi:S-adenosylmethionine synthetase [Sarotherodon galilaeus]
MLTGRSRELADALKTHRIDIACIQETKWTGAKARDMKAQNGVGIVVSQALRDNVVEVTRISDRLMSLIIDTSAVTLQVPRTHLQTFELEEYDVIGGDLNGHVGQDRSGYERFHGGQGFGSRNEDGERALDCAEAYDLTITNTFFKKRLAHLVTYSSGGRDTQIDYWLTRRRHLNLVTDTKVIPSIPSPPSTHYSTLSSRKANPQRPGAPASQSQSGKPKSMWPTAPTTAQYASCAML